MYSVDWLVKILGLHIMSFFYLQLCVCEYLIVLILWILSTAIDQVLTDDCDCNFSNSKSSEKIPVETYNSLFLQCCLLFFTYQNASGIKLHILGHSSMQCIDWVQGTEPIAFPFFFFFLILPSPFSVVKCTRLACEFLPFLLFRRIIGLSS